ncbi:MAG: insulinase family protein [Oscillospiraceae bacterium]|jgi:predicted Zn-dependent peptidase|nr:insulinase family protein [Oscillospiraceae bacterium]
MLQPITRSNGLRVILDPMPSAHSVSLNICIAAGSRYEQPAEAGVFHMIEHMLFKGTQNFSSKEIAEYQDDRGASVSAFTSKEYTCVYSRCLPEYASDMLTLMADMLRNCTLEPSDLANEKRVVFEEIAMYEDSPEDRVFDIFYEHVWPAHPLGGNILGTRSTLQEMQHTLLKKLHHMFYTPERMVISVCGKIDNDAILTAIDEIFRVESWLPAQESAAVVSAPSAVFTPGFWHMNKDLDQNQIVLAFPGLKARDPHRWHAALLAGMLGENSSSRLFMRLREELALVYGVEFFNVHSSKEGISGISMGTSEKNTVRAVSEAIKVLEAFPSSLTEKELRRTKEQAAASLVMSLESCGSRASRAGYQSLLFGDVYEVRESIDRYRSITIEEMRDFTAGFLLPPGKTALCIYGNCSRREESALAELVHQEVTPLTEKQSRRHRHEESDRSA